MTKNENNFQENHLQRHRLHRLHRRLHHNHHLLPWQKRRTNPSTSTSSEVAVVQISKKKDKLVLDNFVISDQTSFDNFLKMNIAFGEYFANDYYMYSIPEKFSRVLSPTSYHKHNFPGKLAIAAVYKGKFLIVSPVCRYPSEKKLS